MMKSLYEELGGTYSLGEDGMYYPNLTLSETDQRPIGKWGRLHMKYLEAEHPGQYERLILNGMCLQTATPRIPNMMDVPTSPGRQAPPPGA